MSHTEDLELAEIQTRFNETFPEAAHLIYEGKGMDLLGAKCLWLGFKSGYILARLRYLGGETGR